MANNQNNSTTNSAGVSCLAIVQQAISQPGLIHDAYRRFHEHIADLHRKQNGHRRQQAPGEQHTP